MLTQHSRVGGEVVPHQDSTFLWTEPAPSAIGIWLALEDATVENGAPWYRPMNPAPVQMSAHLPDYLKSPEY